MSIVHVCPLSALNQTLEVTKASWMISLSGPGKSPQRPDQITAGYLALEFNDIAEPRDGLIPPDMSHVDRIIDCAHQWDQSTPLLIHCWMGISRSTAAALITGMALFPDQNIELLVNTLREQSPMATPNPLMIELADKRLGLGNQLVDAVRSIGRGEDAFEGKPFSLNLAP